MTPRIDTNLVDAYTASLRASRAREDLHDREAAEKKAASIWFVMNPETQKAAEIAAARAGLLEPRRDRHGLTLYPVVRDDRLVWVTIPDRDTQTASSTALCACAPFWGLRWSCPSTAFASEAAHQRRQDLPRRP